MANKTQKEVPLQAAAGARGVGVDIERPQVTRSLYAEGVSSVYSEGRRSVYAEGIGASSMYAEGARQAALTDKTARVAVNVARAQVRSLSRLARLHHRLGRIADYLDKK